MADDAAPSLVVAGLCPECGQEMKAGEGRGVCPGCLWRIAFAADATSEPQAGEAPWARLGDYDLYDEIAHGGMAVVYRARQRRLGRMVAVKVLRGGALADPESRRRFRREADSAGRLKHPGVVAVHDAGEDQGVCWLSMDYVPGETLAQRVQQRPLEAQAAAACVRQVAEAIHHAHGQGVLHRDLKPSNILMGLDDQPKVTDFGLARQLEESTAAGTRMAALTHSAQSMGSPGYAAPEQALAGVGTVLSDVYGLGAVLYHTLTGRAPFVGPTLDSILLQLREAEPVPPRRLNPTVPRGLETICLKCLEKGPEHRYGSAAEVAEDLRRFAVDEPLSARPPGRLVRAVRWGHRKPALAGWVLAFLGAVALGAGGIFYAWRRAERRAVEESTQRRLAEKSFHAARLRLYTSGVYAASQTLLAEDAGLAEDLLDRLIPAEGAVDFRGPEWHLLKHQTRSQDLEVLEGHPWIVTCLAASPDGKWLASGGQSLTGSDGEQSTAFIWEPATGRRVHTFPAGLGTVQALQFTADGFGLMLAAAGKVRMISTAAWSTEGKSVPGTGGSLAHRHPWLAVTDPDAGGVVIYDSGTLVEIRRRPGGGIQAAFSGDDSRLAVLDAEGVTRVGAADGSGVVRAFPAGRRMNGFALSPDGRWLAVCGGPEIMIWDLAEPVAGPPRLLRGHRLEVKHVAFTPRGDRLISTGSDRTIRFWNPAGWQPEGQMRGHRDEVWCALPDPAGRWISTGSKDATVRLWPPRPPEETAGPAHDVNRPAVWSRDGRHLLLARREAGSVVFDPGLLTVGPPLSGQGGAPGPEGQWCRFVADPGRLEWFNAGGELMRRLELEGNPGAHQELDSKIWSADGSRFALGLPEDKTGVWDTATGLRVALVDRPSGAGLKTTALSPDGRRMALAGGNSAVIRLYTVDTGELRMLKGHLAQVQALAFSPDGRQLASGSGDATVRLWSAASGGGATAVLRGHVRDVNALAYAPAGRTLASLGNFEGVRFWNLETATEVAVLPLPLAANALSFSPDGMWLAINQGDPAGRPSEVLERLLLLPTGHNYTGE